MEEGKQGGFSLPLHFKSLGPAGKQKELLCIDNTVDLINRTCPSLIPARFPGKEKEWRGKPQSKKKRNPIMEEVPYALSPTTTTFHIHISVWILKQVWKEDLRWSECRGFTFLSRIQKGSKNVQRKGVLDGRPSLRQRRRAPQRDMGVVEWLSSIIWG